MQTTEGQQAKTRTSDQRHGIHENRETEFAIPSYSEHQSEGECTGEKQRWCQNDEDDEGGCDGASCSHTAK